MTGRTVTGILRSILLLLLAAVIPAAALAYVFRYEDLTRFWPPPHKQPYTVSYSESAQGKTLIHKIIVLEKTWVKETIEDGQVKATMWKDGNIILVRRHKEKIRRRLPTVPLYDDILFGFGSETLREMLGKRGLALDVFSLVRRTPDAIAPVYNCLGCTRFDATPALIFDRDPIRPIAVRYAKDTKPYDAISFAYSQSSVIADKIVLSSGSQNRELLLTEPRKSLTAAAVKPYALPATMFETSARDLPNDDGDETSR